MPPAPALHPQTPEVNPDAALPPDGDRVPAPGMKDAGELALGGVPVGYDLGEERTYLGHPARRLARYMENHQAMRAGRNRIWPTRVFDGFPKFFWEAFTLYARIKAYIALLFSPVTDKELGITPTPDKLARYREGYDWAPKREPEPRITHRLGVKTWTWGTPPPTRAEWKRIDEALGYNVRGTSPTYISQKVRRLRKIQIEVERKARGLIPPVTSIFIPAHSKRGPRHDMDIRNFQMPEDMFVIWPPVNLPDTAPDVAASTPKDPHHTEDDPSSLTGLNAASSMGVFAKKPPRREISKYPLGDVKRNGAVTSSRQREPP